MSARLLRLGALVGAVLALLLIGAPAASAHPLGNFSVNSATALRVEPDAVAVDVVLDLAEIPTLQAFPDATAGTEPAGARAYREGQCPVLAGQTAVAVDGRALALSVVDSTVSFPAGSAGLATTRLVCSLRSAPVEAAGGVLMLTSAVAQGRVGWHEVTANGDGVSLRGSDVPAQSPSGTLTAYPEDLLQSPVDVRSADVQVGAVTGTAAGTGAFGVDSAPGALRGLDRLTASYSDLLASVELGAGVAAGAVLLSVVLGALHAFAPGHGKTLMAAYLVGKDGSLRQAGLIGLSVTATHTLGVLVLGVVLSSVVVVAPERVYPWLSLVSGLLLTGIGLVLLRQGLTRRHAPRAVAAPAHALVAAGAPGAHGHHHSHDHAHDREHSHDHPHDREHSHDHPHEHTHGGSTHSHGPLPTSWRSLVGVGFVGGLVPSPSALVVLLGGIALDRAWFGVLLVVAYGVGMAAALVATGLLLVRARDSLLRRFAVSDSTGPAGSFGRSASALGRALPALTALAVVVVGLAVGAGALQSLL